MNDDNSAYRILLSASHDCHERDLLDVLRNGSEQGGNYIFELVYFDLRHATNFSWFFPCLIAYVQATSRRCTCYRRPRRGHECATAPPFLRSLLLSSKRWCNRILKWKWFYGFSNKHYVTTASEYMCSWCSLRTLAGRPQRAQRRSGIQSRCDLSAVSVTHRGARAHWCGPAQAIGDLHQHQILQHSHIRRLAFIDSTGKHGAYLRRLLAALLPMPHCSPANSRFQ